MAKKIFIDPVSCIGCRACEVACEREHDGFSYITVYDVEEADLSIPYTCRHCENAPCVAVCPTKALHWSRGGVVVDIVKCIGCRLCEIACPFGIPVYVASLKSVVKCDLCNHRLAKGLPIACASTCPTDAIFFGEEEEFIEWKRSQVLSRISKASLESLALKASAIKPVGSEQR